MKKNTFTFSFYLLEAGYMFSFSTDFIPSIIAQKNRFYGSRSPSFVLQNVFPTFICFQLALNPTNVFLVWINSSARFWSSLQPDILKKTQLADLFETWMERGIESHLIWATRLKSSGAAVIEAGTISSPLVMSVYRKMGRTKRSAR